MRTVPAGEFKQHCLALLDEVGVSGEAILITKRGRPVARLGPVSPDDRDDWSGAMADRGRIIGDLVAPATDPEDWEALRG
ncbi:MAG TPA: type II toxin-antitoxin system Phd/YefM family antitoxin [Actinomycetota bacterium]|nr:type II toxin-antitoxin system Phd/YefM family antitoxin [Actinomycetota bacterium]